MPFDGTHYTTRGSTGRDLRQLQSKHAARLLDVYGFAMGTIMVIMLYLFASGLCFPETGTTARIIHGNAVVNENLIASEIMYDKSDWYKLKDMMGQEYEIVVPRYELSAVEAQAWWARAARHKWTPAGDFGPFAIDP